MVFRLFIFALAGMAVSFTAFAQDRIRASSGEDVAIAFFKTGNMNPDFDLWARQSDAYKTAPPAFAGDYIRDEKQRLIKRWKDYDAQSGLITVRAPVSVSLKISQQQDGAAQYWLAWAFNSGDVTYFPFSYQDYNFAVIPQLLEKFSRQTLAAAQFELMRKVLGEDLRGSATMEMTLKPIKSYMDAPRDIGGNDQWALIANIASLNILSEKDGASLWSYGAPWYVSPAMRELRQLHEAQEIEKAQENQNPVP